MKILDIGCGDQKYAGDKDDTVVGLDINKVPGVDVVWDLNKLPYPFEDNEFDLVHASHTLEHLEVNIWSVFEEIHRILKPNGIFKIAVPHFSGWLYNRDWTHKHGASINSFDEIIEGTDIGKRYYTTEGVNKSLFRAKKKRIETAKAWFFVEWFANRFPHFYEKTGLTYIFPASTVYFDLEAIK